MCCLYCLAAPAGKALDYFLGGHSSSRYAKKDLKALIELHQAGADDHHGDSEEDALTKEEVKMIIQTIDMRALKVTDIMVPMKDLMVLNEKDKYNRQLMKKIASSGYSKIPVYRGQKPNIQNLLVTKNLLRTDTSKNT